MPYAEMLSKFNRLVRHHQDGPAALQGIANSLLRYATAILNNENIHLNLTGSLVFNHGAITRYAALLRQGYQITNSYFVILTKCYGDNEDAVYLSINRSFKFPDNLRNHQALGLLLNSGFSRERIPYAHLDNGAARVVFIWKKYTPDEWNNAKFEESFAQDLRNLLVVFACMHCVITYERTAELIVNETHQDVPPPIPTDWREEKTRTSKLLKQFLGADYPDSFHPFVHSTANVWPFQTIQRLEKAEEFFNTTLKDLLAETTSTLIQKQIDHSRHEIKLGKHVINRDDMAEIKLAVKKFRFYDLKHFKRGNYDYGYPILYIRSKNNCGAEIKFSDTWENCVGIHTDRYIDRNKLMDDIETLLDNCMNRDATVINFSVFNHNQEFVVQIKSDGIININNFMAQPIRYTYRQFEYFKVIIDTEAIAFHWDSSERDPDGQFGNVPLSGYTIQLIFPI
ncbi:hypothetical protein MASR1M36_11990 [Candidatus Cloacimonadaceae bacterium]